MTSAGFNRRMRKTACPVVWKGCRFYPGPDPINSKYDSRANTDLRTEFHQERAYLSAITE